MEVKKQKFNDACHAIIGNRREANGIGTLGEKTLHAILKLYFEIDTTKHEKRVGTFVADIVTKLGIIEIQTRSFDKLRKKLELFLKISPVTIVYPIPKTKWLLWINEETGEITKKRKSPKQGSIYDSIFELYKIKSLLSNDNLRLNLVFIDIEEYRYLNGWSEDKKKGSSRCDRIPVNLVMEVLFDNSADFMRFIPETLPEHFTSKDLMKEVRISLKTAQMTLNILSSLEIIKRVDKQGKLYLYERNIGND